jgi:hypothetical protein
MMVTSKVLVSSHAAASPSKTPRPIVEELSQIAAVFLMKCLFVIFSLLDKYTTPSDIRVVLFIVKVPGHQFELALVNTAVLTSAVTASGDFVSSGHPK